MVSLLNFWEGVQCTSIVLQICVSFVYLFPGKPEAKLQEVLEDFALPSSPATLRRALLSRAGHAEPPPMMREAHYSSSPMASEAWYDTTLTCM